MIFAILSSDSSSWRLVVSLSDTWQIGRYLTVISGAAVVRAQAHGADGGTALDATSGTGHLNPVYLGRVLEVGGRYVCGDPKSLMPAWLAPAALPPTCSTPARRR